MLQEAVAAGATSAVVHASARAELETPGTMSVERCSSAAEQMLHPLEELGHPRARLALAGAAQLLQQLALARGEVRGHLHDHLVDRVAAAAAAHEDLVRPDVQNHVEVACGPVLEPALALAAQAELVAVLHPGRDRDLEQALAGDAALAAARGARVADDPALAVAVRARARHREEALGEAH